MRKKIKIGYDSVDIKFIDFKDKSMMGEYDSATKTIKIKKDLQPVEKGNTLFHEIMHAALDELTVNVLTNAFVQVIKDNKWFLPYLEQLINGEKNVTWSRGKVMARRKKSIKKRTRSKN
jgi:hypothetical protein